MKINKAERKQSKMKIALQGPSGSGKTFSSLLLAHGLCGSWSKTVVIDTENGSSNLYAHLGAFNVIQITAPYSPEKFIEAIILAERSGMEVIILDSISHEWEGQGGILDVHSSMMGNSFTNWAKLTPRHNGFVQKILSSSCHVIGTIRSKQDYVLTQKNGKHVPEKVGLKGVTRENMDYEFTVVLDLNIKHNAVASKDRTQLFMDQPSFIVTQSTGRLIKNWCEEGLDPLILVQPFPETNQHKPLDSDEVNDTILFNRKMNSADSHHQQLNENFKFSENGNS
ncbi:MAG: AAA family ATPase [Bacteroidetes bacterium]|nr:AAA family ATPase [Bacteroidota bacterium]